MKPGPIFQSRRSELLAELKKLVSMLHDSGPGNSEDDPNDPIDDEGLSDLDLKELIESYRSQQSQELHLFRHVFPNLEDALVAVAKKNREGRGVLGFTEDDLNCEGNAGLGFCMYPRASVFRLARLLGWQTRQEVQICSDCGGPHIETLWVLPSVPLKINGVKQKGPK